jgi:hypothetical protein
MGFDFHALKNVGKALKPIPFLKFPIWYGCVKIKISSAACFRNIARDGGEKEDIRNNQSSESCIMKFQRTVCLFLQGRNVDVHMWIWTTVNPSNLFSLSFVSRQGLGFFLFTIESRTVLGPTQPPIQWAPGALSLGVKLPGREADHSPSSSAEVKNAWSYTSTPPMRLHGVVLS